MTDKHNTKLKALASLVSAKCNWDEALTKDEIDLERKRNYARFFSVPPFNTRDWFREISIKAKTERQKYETINSLESEEFVNALQKIEVLLNALDSVFNDFCAYGHLNDNEAVQELIAEEMDALSREIYKYALSVNNLRDSNGIYQGEPRELLHESFVLIWKSCELIDLASELDSVLSIETIWMLFCSINIVVGGIRDAEMRKKGVPANER